MRFTAGSALLALLSLATLAIAAPLPDGGSAFTGAGGQAVGGSHNINDYANGVGRIDTLNIDRGNAGNGGKATSGTAVGGVGHNGTGGSAYSGVGGNTNGGNINENHLPRGGLGSYGWPAPYGVGGLDTLNIGEGNAGDGGDSSSGSAFGGASFFH